MAAALGWSAARPEINFGLLLLAVISVVLSVSGSSWLAILAGPSAYIVVRLALPGSLFPSDAVIVLASIIPAFRVDWRQNRSLRTCLMALAFFDAMLALSVLTTFSVAGALEIAHRTAIVGGGLLVGAFLLYSGRTRLAMWIYLLTSAILGVATTITYLTNGFSPAYPFGIQKNYIGSLLSSALLMSVMLRPTGLPRTIALRASQLAVAAGLLATQSRGAILGLVVGALIWAFLAKRSRSLIVVLILTVIPILVVSIQSELQLSSTFSPTATRLRFAQDAIQTWLGSPLLGNGLRFFQAGSNALASDPHDIVLLTLAESGLLGLLGLAVLLGRTLLTLLRLNSLMAQAAIAMLAARFVHGLVDVYWVHGSQEIPWIIAGMAIAGGSVAYEAGMARGQMHSTEQSVGQPASASRRSVNTSSRPSRP